jgi:hypothetical protein
MGPLIGLTPPDTATARVYDCWVGLGAPNPRFDGPDDAACEQGAALFGALRQSRRLLMDFPGGFAVKHCGCVPWTLEATSLTQTCTF